MLETKTGVFFIAGLGFFAVAFLSNAVLPIMMYRHLPEQSVEQMLEHNANLRFQFEDLRGGSPRVSPRPTADRRRIPPRERNG